MADYDGWAVMGRTRAYMEDSETELWHMFYQGCVRGMHVVFFSRVWRLMGMVVMAHAA